MFQKVRLFSTQWRPNPKFFKSERKSNMPNTLARAFPRTIFLSPNCFKPQARPKLDVRDTAANKMQSFLALKRLRNSREIRWAQKDVRPSIVNPEQKSKALGACVAGKVPAFYMGEESGNFCGKDSLRWRVKKKILCRENYLKMAGRQESSGCVERMVNSTCWLAHWFGD